MLDLIAHDLWHVSLLRLIHPEKLTPYWEITASFGRGPTLTVTGPTPDAALSLMAIRAISSPTFMPPSTSMILDPIAGNLLRLLLMRSRRQTELSSLWTVTAWTRTQPAVSAVGQMPDEALRNLVLMLNPSHT